MELLENIRISLSAIRMNLARAIITIFIIGFGIMALISMLTAVDGIKNALYSNFASVGSNSFNIQSEDPLQGMKSRGFIKSANPPVSYQQAMDFAKRYRFPSKATISYSAASDAVAKFHSIQTAPKLPVMGVDENYLSAVGLQLKDGRNFNTKEIESGRNVTIIGYKLREDLFGTQDAIGSSILINGNSYSVIGYLEEKGSSFGSSQDNFIIIPIRSAQKNFAGNNETDYNISVQVTNVEELDDAIDEATGLFRAIRKLKISQDNNFSISKSDSLAKIVVEQVSVLQIIALAIGLITLLGAAVGLTNIMLVSVTERTREIGTRKALGATGSNIRKQFLMEAIVITLIGGIFGVIAGIGLGNIVANYFNGHFIFPVGWTIFGLILCIITGVLAGWYPASKASRLNPVEALRYE
jgi:putative ABC transport system permease protein